MSFLGRKKGYVKKWPKVITGGPRWHQQRKKGHEKRPSGHDRHLLGLPKNHVPKSLPLGCGPQYVLPGGLGHLQVPWESLMGPKLKIYVEIICCEHFVFFEKKKIFLLVIFSTWYNKKCIFHKIKLEKLLTKIFFFLKIKDAQSIWFPHRFSISDP